MRNSVKVGAVTAAALCHVTSPAMAARMAAVQMRIDITSASGANAVNAIGRSYNYTARFQVPAYATYDDGNRTYSYFGLGSSLISSKVFKLIPYTQAVTDAYQMVSGTEYDYPDYLIRNLFFSHQRYHDKDGVLYQTVSDVTFLKYFGSTGGTGSGDSEITTGEIGELLKVGAVGSFYLLDRAALNSANRVDYGGTATVTSFSMVPEPATWALMITGFGAVGGAMRRRSVREKLRLG